MTGRGLFDLLSSAIARASRFHALSTAAFLPGNFPLS